MGKIKQFIVQGINSEKGKDILIITIVILVGLGSFELGRLSKNNIGSGIKILNANNEKYDEQSVKEANILSSITATSTKKVLTEDSVGKKFFASNRGSKYYSIGCSGGKTIKQENRIYFTTKEEAEKVGYTLSSSCN